VQAKKKLCPTCGELAYLWNRTIGCKSCVSKSKGNSLKSTKIDRRSEKRVVQEKEYSKLRRKHLEENPLCFVCGGEADQIHHRMQIRYGDFLNDTAQFRSACAPCHRSIHNNVAHSIENGYLASKEEKANYLKENINLKHKNNEGRNS